MLEVNLQLDPTIQGVEAHLLATEKHIELAARRAINKTATGMRTHIARKVARDVGVKVKAVRNSLCLNVAKGKSLEATITLGRAYLSAFYAKKSARNQTRALKGYPGASKTFVATMPSGHKAIFKRRTKERLKIDKQYVIWREQSQTEMEQAENRVSQQLQKNFEHELNFILNHVRH